MKKAKKNNKVCCQIAEMEKTFNQCIATAERIGKKNDYDLEEQAEVALALFNKLPNPSFRELTELVTEIWDGQKKSASSFGPMLSPYRKGKGKLPKLQKLPKLF